MTQVYLRRRINSAHSKDAAICAQVNRAIQNAGYSQLNRVRATCRDGEVELSGTVPSYFLKSQAQEAASAISGIKGIANVIAVSKATNPSLDQ